MQFDSKDGFRSSGGHPKKFKFTYQDIADLLGVSVPYLRKLVSQGKFDPNSLPSIIEFYNKRNWAISCSWREV